MDTHLTEIKNAHLFMEYLMSIGAKSPRSRRDNWELVVDRHRGRQLAAPLPHHLACGSAPGGSRS